MPRYRYAPLPAALLLCACVSLPPEGPAVMALPGSGRTFEQFRLDDQICREFAGRSIGPQTPAGAAVDSAAASAVLGTAIGAAVGAAVDGSSGAAVGAGFGLLVGSVSGAAAGNASGYALQQRYDQSYVQCMYGRGHKVPVIGGHPLRAGDQRHPVGEAGSQQRLQRLHLIIEIEADGADGAAAFEVLM